VVVHLVFVPKYRRNVFTDEILARCEEIVREVCTKANAELREFNGEADHVAGSRTTTRWAFRSRSRSASAVSVTSDSVSADSGSGARRWRRFVHPSNRTAPPSGEESAGCCSVGIALRKAEGF
jgi:hypothetical protein